MAVDTLLLGPVIFTDFATPDRMGFGGRHQTVVHKMPGGTRIVDRMGRDDDERRWRGILWGDNAFADMLTLDALRQAGTELPFSWGAESRLAVINFFKAEVEKYTCIHYEIEIVLTDGGIAGLIASLDSLVSSDLSAAMAM